MARSVLCCLPQSISGLQLTALLRKLWYVYLALASFFLRANCVNCVELRLFFVSHTGDLDKSTDKLGLDRSTVKNRRLHCGCISWEKSSSRKMSRNERQLNLSACNWSNMLEPSVWAHNQLELRTSKIKTWHLRPRKVPNRLFSRTRNFEKLPLRKMKAWHQC